MEPELIFMTVCLGFGALSIAWCMMVGRLHARALLGISGALLGALVTGAFWQADRFEWVGMLLKPILAVWLGAMVLSGMAIGSGWGKPTGVRVAAIVLGVIGLVLHAGAMVMFLWMAAMGV
jgi:hypothetical protein